MLRVMPCGPCAGVSEVLPEFKPCRTCDRRATGYAEGEAVAFGDADPGVFPRTPIAPRAQMWDPFPGQRAAEAICENYLPPLDESIAAVEQQLRRLLLTKAARQLVAMRIAAEGAERPALRFPDTPSFDVFKCGNCGADQRVER